MFVLGLQGSPRKKSNTEYLMAAFMEAARKKGAETVTIDVCRKHIEPCKELIVCEKKGFCPIDDDMKHEIYPLLRKADAVVIGTPIFFYNATAQLKAVIDRCQTLWARKYRLKLEDPGHRIRRGFLLSVAATRGRSLFDGLHLTAKYFFDAIAADYHGHLTYPAVEHRGDMEKHPGLPGDVDSAVAGFLQPFVGRRKVLFVSQKGTCRAPMAAAFARYLAGTAIDASYGCLSPGEHIDPAAVTAMASAGIDLAFHRPVSVAQAVAGSRPDMVVVLDRVAAIPELDGVPVDAWEVPVPSPCTAEQMAGIRDEIRRKVVELAGL